MWYLSLLLLFLSAKEKVPSMNETVQENSMEQSQLKRGKQVNGKSTLWLHIRQQLTKKCLIVRTFILQKRIHVIKINRQKINECRPSSTNLGALGKVIFWCPLCFGSSLERIFKDVHFILFSLRFWDLHIWFSVPGNFSLFSWIFSP